MKTLLLVLIFVSFSYAQGLDALLNDYAKESELSKKTKDESAGNLIIYTRDDLERMQVESLKDILKSLRFFQYAENRMAQPDILNEDPLSYYSKGVRIYLNEHELLSSLAGSGVLFFGDMEMDFIDHVEIYQGFPSFEFGVEPATIVIRLYSKTAEHDEGGRVKGMVGSFGTNKENVYYANIADDLSYFFYANRTDDKKEKYEHDGETLSRDLITSRFYGSLESENHNVEFHAMKADGDAFIGSAVGNVPVKSLKETNYLSLSTSSKFLNDSLTLNLSYININTNYLSKYSLTKPIINPFPFLLITEYEQNLEEDAFTSSLKKEWKFDWQTIVAGIQYRYKHFDLSDLKFNGLDSGVLQAYDSESVYSVFLEDSITLNDSNLITLSVMNQEYVRNGDVDNQNTLQLRFGYIYTDDEWVSKTFISRQEFASEPYMTLSPYYGNAELKPETYTSIFQELSYKTPSTLSKIIFGYGENEDLPILDPTTFKIKNSDIDIVVYSTALEFTLYFSQKDKLELQAGYINIESPFVENDNTEHYNYTLRMLNTIDRFDVFNELVIHTGYEDVDNGFDYSVGIKYEVNKDLHFNLKGDNIFNTGLNDKYLNKTPPLSPSVEMVEVPRIEQRFTVGMEYLF